MDRRDFLRSGFWLTSAAGAVTAGVSSEVLQAQNNPARNTPPQNDPHSIHRPGRYEDSLMFQRKRTFSWPNGKTLAVWIIPNVEVLQFDKQGAGPLASGPSSVPDVRNYAWQEYGMRVGLWRIAEVMSAAGIRATVALNSGVCEVFPQAIDEMKRLGWEFMGHGITNSVSLRNAKPDQEKDMIQTTLRTIEQATGKRPRGWLGPGLAETFSTPDVLAEEGVLYVGDWYNDDQPYPMKVKKGSLTSISYSMEINDAELYGYNHYLGPQYLSAVTDQFDQLYKESRKLPKVFGIPIHPYLTGAALRIKYFQQLIAHMQEQEGVWFATGSEILEAYRNSQS